MIDIKYKTPILFLIFNRPDTSKTAFDAIKKIRPAKLYIAADGPRSHVKGELEVCNITRQAVLDLIDWECEVKTLFREHNLGSGRAVSQAISWLFEHEEEGIILEDDCLPSQDFFRYCETLLPYYRQNPEIMHIGGTGVLSKKSFFGEASYYYSRYPAIWGWATWKRAWKFYNFELENYNTEVLFVKNRISKNKDKGFWFSVFKVAYKQKRRDIWDYQWVFNIWKGKGFCIIPNYNMITNVGFGKDATHTFEENELSNLSYEALPQVIVHPSSMVENANADDMISNIFQAQNLSIWQRVINKIKKYMKRLN